MSGDSASPGVVLTARVTDVVDPITFWAQIGTESHLVEFDRQCSVLSRWCEDGEGGEGRGLPKVNDVVMVRDSEEPSQWHRAKVICQLSDTEVQVFFIDLGTTLSVPLSNVCAATPPMMCSSPQQALLCTLHGVTPTTVDEKDVLSHFVALCKSPLRATLHSSYTDPCDVSLYTLTSDNQWTSIGHILQTRKLAKCEQQGPVVLDIAKEISSSSSQPDLLNAPLLSDSKTATPTNLHRDSAPLTPVGSPSPSDTSIASLPDKTVPGEPTQPVHSTAELPATKGGGVSQSGSAGVESVSSDDEWDESLLQGSSSSCSEAGRTPNTSPSKPGSKVADLKISHNKLRRGGGGGKGRGFQRHYESRGGWRRGGQWERPNRGRGFNNGNRFDGNYFSEFEPPGGGFARRSGSGQAMPARRDILDAAIIPIPQAPPPSPPSHPHKILGMSETEKSNECEWLAWKVKNKAGPLLEALFTEDVSAQQQAARRVKEVLAEQSAEKLSFLSGELVAVSVVLESLIAQCLESKTASPAVCVSAVEALYGVMGEGVTRSLKPVMEKLTSNAMSHSGRQSAFCMLLGQLFLSACRSGLASYSTAVGKVMRYFLNFWSHYGNESDLMSVAKAKCLSALCECVGPTLDASSRDTLDEYFNGTIKDSLLSARLTRPAKEVLLELYVRRSHWAEAPPTSENPVPHFSTEAPPLTESILQPSPVTPANCNGPQNGTEPQSVSVPFQPVSVPYQQHPQPQQPASVPYKPNSQSAFVQVSPVQPVSVPFQPAEATPPSQYAEVERMLQSLQFEELLGKFKAAMIRDNVLSFDSDVVRAALKEAGIPAGAVLSIMGYLANRQRPATSTSQQSVATPPMPNQQVFSYSYQPQQSPGASLPPPPPTPPAYQPQLPLHQAASFTPQPAAACPPLYNAANRPLSLQSPPMATGSMPSLTPPTSQSQTSQFSSGSMPASAPSAEKPVVYSLPRDDPKPVGVAPGRSCDQQQQQQQPAVRKGGFGSFRCIICCTSDHSTDMCPDRADKFFFH